MITTFVDVVFAPNIRCEEIDELKGVGFGRVNLDLAAPKSSNVTLRSATPCFSDAI